MDMNAPGGGRGLGWWGWLWLLLVCLSPAGARADEERFLVLWSSASTAEEAKKELERFTASSWPEVLAVPSGYPRVEESSKVPGLRPGFWVVSLGVCSTEASAGSTTDMLRAIGKALSVPVKASVRKIRDPRPMACPSLPMMRQGSGEPWFRMTWGTGSPRHKLEFFHIPWAGWTPPQGQDAEFGPVVLVLMVEGRAVDGRLAPLGVDFLSCVRSEHCPLINVSRPGTAVRDLRLLRDMERDPERKLDCDAYNVREEATDNRYESFSLSELEVSWDERRLVKVRRKALGFKCCRVFTDECLEDKGVKPEQ
ncbi:hypothetical protein NR798_15355 [Archangium gephyra]|uniref:hypothetical protein n=1 Tax=Archangium gephyra TaxID=48 RepID=UPI0035D4B714